MLGCIFLKDGSVSFQNGIMKYSTDWQNVSAKDGTTGNEVKDVLYFSWSQRGQAEEKCWKKNG